MPAYYTTVPDSRLRGMAMYSLQSPSRHEPQRPRLPPKKPGPELAPALSLGPQLPTKRTSPSHTLTDRIHTRIHPLICAHHAKLGSSAETNRASRRVVAEASSFSGHPLAAPLTLAELGG